jgi:hypothetical protein
MAIADTTSDASKPGRSAPGPRRLTAVPAMGATTLAITHPRWCEYHEASTLFSYINKNWL